MLFQISCYDLSWNEAKKIIKELLCYPLENYPSDIMILKGWNGFLSKNIQLEADSNEEKKGFLKKLIKIAEMDVEFATEQKKIDSESAIFILSFLKALFKKTLSLIKALGKVPKSITLPKHLFEEEHTMEPITAKKTEKNENPKMHHNDETLINSKNHDLVSENYDEVANDKCSNFGLELLYYDDIRGPVSLQITGIEIEQSVRESIKNLMDQKSGTITLIMNDWVMVNEIKEYVPINEEKPPKMFHLLVYWRNSENPSLYESIETIELKVSAFLQFLFQNQRIEMENISLSKASSLNQIRMQCSEFLKDLSKFKEKLTATASDTTEREEEINTKIKPGKSELLQSEQTYPQQFHPQQTHPQQLHRAQPQESQIEFMENRQNPKYDRRIQQEIKDLDRIINQKMFSNEEKILLRVLDVVSALNYNNQKKSI
jgi:hypothetical protein